MSYQWVSENGHCRKTGKRCYETRKTATVVAHRATTHGTAYKCPFCRKYHVTSQSKRLSRAIQLVRSITDSPRYELTDAGKAMVSR
jgi:hypothetical protein